MTVFIFKDLSKHTQVWQRCWLLSPSRRRGCDRAPLNETEVLCADNTVDLFSLRGCAMGNGLTSRELSLDQVVSTWDAEDESHPVGHACRYLKSKT